MSCSEKSKQYIEELEHEKIMMETQFAQIEQVLQNGETKSREEITQILSVYNNTSVQYQQLCADLISFIKIFNIEEKKDIRLYKLEEVTELLAKAINELEN